MTTELVTAHAGTNHVDSEDIGALYAGALGDGRYVLDVGEGMAVSMKDANTLRIGTGGFVFDGRWVRVTDAEEVKVQSGYQAAYRKDLVTYTYTRDPSSGNVETGEWGVVTGTAASKEGDAKLPTVETGSILDRDLKVVCPVAEVDIAGLTPTAKLLLPSVRSLKSIGESVSQAKNALIKAEDAGVAGYAGRVSVRHDGFGTSSSPHGFVSDEETFVQVTGFLWTDNEQTGAWPALVKAPWQPDDLKDYWCVKVPVKVAKEGAVNVAHRSHVDADCVLYSEAAGDGTLAYSGTTTKRLFSSTDGLLYVALHKEKPAGLPAILYVDATIPLMSL